MKKIISIFILLLVSGCSVQRITEVLFIASIGIEKEEDEYVGYFYLPSSEDVGKTNDFGTGVGQYAKIRADSLEMLFGKSQSNVELMMDLRHVASIIINESLLNEEFINEMIDFFKNSNLCDFNFYLFVTKDEFEDIYGFKNPNKESVLNSIIVSTTDSSALFLSCSPLHFLNFCRDYFKDRCIKIPYLVVDKIWIDNKEEISSFHCSNMVLYYKNKYRVVLDNLGFYVKKNTHFFDKMGEFYFEIKDYDWRLMIKNKIIIDVKFESNLNLDLIVNDKISLFIESYKEMDPFNLVYYNNVYNKNLSYEDIVININN